LLTLMTFHLCITLAFLPLHQVTVVTAHVRVPGLVSIAIGAANLGLGFSLAVRPDWDSMALPSPG
jgi:hypothetical protein